MDSALSPARLACWEADLTMSLDLVTSLIAHYEAGHQIVYLAYRYLSNDWIPS